MQLLFSALLVYMGWNLVAHCHASTNSTFPNVTSSTVIASNFSSSSSDKLSTTLTTNASLTPVSSSAETAAATAVSTSLSTPFEEPTSPGVSEHNQSNETEQTTTTGVSLPKYNPKNENEQTAHPSSSENPPILLIGGLVALGLAAAILTFFLIWVQKVRKENKTKSRSITAKIRSGMEGANHKPVISSSQRRQRRGVGHAVMTERRMGKLTQCESDDSESTPNYFDYDNEVKKAIYEKDDDNDVRNRSIKFESCFETREISLKDEHRAPLPPIPAANGVKAVAPTASPSKGPLHLVAASPSHRIDTPSTATPTSASKGPLQVVAASPNHRLDTPSTATPSSVTCDLATIQQYDNDSLSYND